MPLWVFGVEEDRPVAEERRSATLALAAAATPLWVEDGPEVAELSVKDGSEIADEV